MRHPLLVRTAAVALSVALGLGLSACSSDEPADTATDGDSSQTLDITVADGAISPNGERIELGIGEEITINVDSDVAGSFHVHSTPEQEVEFTEGESTSTLSFDRPGVVEMESHDPTLVVAQFEVR